MRRLLPWLVLAGFLALAVALFFVLFAAPVSDDYAGWSLAIAGLALPAWFVLLRRRDPIGPVGALAVALPGGAGLGCVVLSLVALMRLPDAAQLGALVLFGPVLALAVAVVMWLRCRRLSARDAVRRSAVVVGAPALLALLLHARAWPATVGDPGGAELSFEQGLALAFILLDLLPLVWALAIGLAWLATTPAGPRTRRDRAR